ncbi:MAG: autotransporter outer membrane beta-barrel domain-containing protein [Rhizobiales bacterium]|nr:autotransporter outer membrane beta-barrel domain-containing protein [Hyphomicrobiales bacterium]
MTDESVVSYDGSQGAVTSAGSFVNCTAVATGTAGFGTTTSNCATGDSVVFFAAGGIQTYDMTITLEHPGNGTVYTVKVNISADIGRDHTVNSMSITGGEFDAIPVNVEEQLANFSSNRAGNLLNNQPNIGGFIDGSGTFAGSNPFGALSAYGSTSFDGSSFNMSYANSLSRVARLSQNRVERTMAAAYKQQPQKDDAPFQHVLAYGDEGSANAVPADQRRWDVWMQVYGAHSDVGDTSTDFWVGYAGAHYFVTPDVIIGALAQIDYANSDNSATGSKADGLGWMIGPYLAAKLPDHPLYFEARLAWGQSDNNIAPTGGTEDDFDTTRWLGSAKLSGAFKVKSITIKPSVQVSYFNEKQHSYVDSTATTIAAQTTEVGELRWGPTFSTTIGTDDGLFITPSLGVHGIWNFVADEAAGTTGTLPGTEDVRSTVDAGLGIRNGRGLAFNITGFYDGIGLNDYEAYGGTARVSVPIQ